MAVQAVVSGGRRNIKRKGLLHFTQWKQKAVELLLQDDELMKLLTYHTEDWNDMPNVSEEDRYKLVDTQIYQYSFIDTIAQEQKSYIGIGMSHYSPDEGFRRFSNEYISGFMYFYILVDRNIITTNVGCRTDLILGRIYDIFQGCEEFGMGEIRPESVLERWVDNSTHGGYTIGFKIVEMK
ncbi:hypothetical protein JXA27_06985 [Aerococcaceae bacterium zg-B36]|uniref:hypothetical protein n=1 Tax=Aerococcaceae bacterium zg-252 TaxID=2796928 RepID=UPI001BD8A5C1|nr:hypothetical protein [Aerococcaceae bacterium zg-B36]